MKKKLVLIGTVLALAVILFLFIRSTDVMASNPDLAKTVNVIAAVLGGLCLAFKNRFNSEIALAVEWGAYTAPAAIMLAQLLK
jgi:hypothetical protein